MTVDRDRPNVANGLFEQANGGRPHDNRQGGGIGTEPLAYLSLERKDVLHLGGRHQKPPDAVSDHSGARQVQAFNLKDANHLDKSIIVEH